MLTNLLRVLLNRSFNPFVFKSNIKYELDLNVKNLGIYVHIPFCESLCTYCPYNKEKYNSSTAERFVNALIREIRLASPNTGRPKKISSIYFGGGSPALLTDHLSLIISEIKNIYKVSGNIGIELHPRDINKETMAKLKECGVDMVSVGVQSFQQNCLSVLGRENDDIKSKLEILQSADFKTIDIDLIFGIPGQTLENLRQDFLTAVNYGATQISTYPFIDFSFTNNKATPLGKLEKKKMLKGLLDASRDLGYERTSVWTFAKKGTPKYSSVTRDSFIGFGPSATTLLHKTFKINTFSVHEYIKCVDEGKIPTSLVLEFNERTRAVYWLFWSSYNLVIDRKSFLNLFNRKVEDVFGFELFLAKKLNFIEVDGENYRLTEKGAYLFHLIEQAYTHQYIDKTWRIAAKEAWPKEISLY